MSTSKSIIDEINAKQEQLKSLTADYMAKFGERPDLSIYWDSQDDRIRVLTESLERGVTVEEVIGPIEEGVIF